MQLETREEIWGEVGAELREQLGADRFDRWLAPLRLLDVTDREFRLGAPNKFWLEWIENRYLQAVSDVVARRLGRPMKVTLAIDPELFRSFRQSQQVILAAVPDGAAPGVDGAEGAPRDGFDDDAVAARPAPWSPQAPGRSPGPGPLDVQTLKNFVVGPSNRMAYHAALRVVENPGEAYNPFFIHGSCGLGKTHLLRGISHALRNRHPEVQVRFLNGEEFLNQFVASLKGGTIGRFRDRFRSPQVLVLDDIHLLGNKTRTQEEFLHTFNALVDAGHQIIMSSDRHPRGIGNMQEALVGRFVQGLVVVVNRPEQPTRLEILRRRAETARVPFSKEVLELIAESVRTSIRELIGAYNILEEYSFQEEASLDAAKARFLLTQSLCIGERRTSLQQIVELVSRHYSIPVPALVSPSRQRSLTLARQVAMFLGRKYTGRSLAEIGKHFGGRNHTSVKTAEVRIDRLRQANPGLAKDIETISNSLDG